jgi:cytoskeletal protein CcmA (bactofilin family)
VQINMAMFTKTDDANRPQKSSLPGAGRARPLRFRNSSVIVSTRKSEEELSLDAGLVIEGNLECSVVHHRNKLTVAKNARVKGDIQSNIVDVLGKVVGNIYSEGMVSLVKGCEVIGDISCAGLYIDEDAKFTGEINMQDLPNVVIMPNDTLHAEPVQARPLQAELSRPQAEPRHPVSSQSTDAASAKAETGSTQAAAAEPARPEPLQPNAVKAKRITAKPDQHSPTPAEPVRAKKAEARNAVAEPVRELSDEEKSPRPGKGQPHVAKPGIYA